MKNLLVTLFFALFAQQGIGQTIFKSPELKKGIYKDFNEFVTNSPSVILDDESIVIDEDEKKLVDDFKSVLFISGGKIIKLPIFRLKDTKTNARINTKDFWGFCDEAKVYINSFTHIPRHYFIELLLVGRYCYFIQLDANANSRPGNNMGMGLPANTNGVAEYIINVNNGKIFLLDKKLLKVILKDDSELLEEFNKDKDLSGKLLIDYVKKYNERHENEIKSLH